MSQTLQLIKKLKTLSKEQQQLFLQSLTPTEQLYLLKNPLLKLDEKQLAPEGNWRYFWFRGARGTGKTEAGIAWIVDRILTGDIEVAIVGPTYNDLIKEIIPRLLKCLATIYPPKDIQVNLTHGLITIQKTKTIKLYSSENEIRGLNASACYCEETAKWCKLQPDKIDQAFKVLDYGIRRKSANPCQIFIASTPKPYPFFIRFDNHCKSHSPLHIQRKLTIDEANYIDPATKAAIKAENPSRLDRQELYADLLTDTPGAYWTRELLDNCQSQPPSQYISPPKTYRLNNDQLMGRLPEPDKQPTDAPYLIRTGIGFDPSVSKGNDECGIIVASLYSNNKAYVISDRSGQYDPNEWSKLISQLYIDHNAAFMVVEKNNGGNTFDYIMRSVNPYMKIIPVHAKEGKTTRAEHTSALYYQGRVFHTDTFSDLEDQMCSFSPNYSKSPDRLDALNLVLTELFFPSNHSNPNSIRNLPSF